jgi:hypothetical protein
MVKRLLYLFITMLTMTPAKSQDLLVTPSDTLTLDTTSGCQSESIMTYSIKNTTANTLNMNWQFIYSTLPHGWTIGYCDPHLCRTGMAQISTGIKQFQLDSGVTGYMQLEPVPASGSASGLFQVFMWASNDSANTAKYLTYKVSITTPQNCTAAGITETDLQQISLYPNPVRNDLRVTVPQPLSNGQIDIYNLIGSRVYTQALTSTAELDLSALEGGIYVVRITDAGHTLITKKFTKID